MTLEVSFKASRLIELRDEIAGNKDGLVTSKIAAEGIPVINRLQIHTHSAVTTFRWTKQREIIRFGFAYSRAFRARQSPSCYRSCLRGCSRLRRIGIGDGTVNGE